MTRSRMWTAGTAAVIVGVLVIGWFLLISPKRTEAADLKVAAADTAAQNASLEAQARQLKAEYEKLPAQRAQIAAIERQIPKQPLEPALIRQLSDAAVDANVDLRSITPAPLADVTGAEGVQYISTTIVAKGDFSHLKAFLNNLEENKRAILVTGLTIGPSTDDANVLQLSATTRVFVATAATATTPTAGATSGSVSNATPTAASDISGSSSGNAN